MRAYGKSKKIRKIWLLVGIFTSVSAVVAIPVIVLSAVNKSYFLMAVAIALVAHGMYGVTFYFLAFARAGERLRVLRAVTEDGLRSYTSIGAAAGLTPTAARDALSTLLSRDYLRGFYLGSDGLLPIVSEVEEAPSEIACDYCGGVYLGEECPFCGAKSAKDAE